MGRGLAETDFATWLDAELKKRRWGVRTLARKMAPNEVERARRVLNRCLFEGSYPNLGNRLLIATALEVEEAELPSPPFRSEAA
jgi:hypothetical protein